MERSSSHKLTVLLGAIGAMVVGIWIGYAWNAMMDTQTDASKSATATSLTSVAGKASADRHNNADITFAQMMTPHHSQAIEMAKLAATRASSAEVKTLAAKVESAQQPEIDKMNGWLSEWDAPAMAMDHSGHGGMSGMMNADSMVELANKSGADFDKAFLAMMIEHHSGALDMAKDELSNGQYAETLAMAGAILITQQAEIDEMKAMLR